MRNLPSIINDLGYLAQLMDEQAKELREVAAFFCGGAGTADVGSTAVQLPALLMQPQPMPAPVGRKHATPVSQSGHATRVLTAEEKDAIRADWEAIHPNQRNKTNRLALSRKWCSSPTQIRAVTQEIILRDLRASQASQAAGAAVTALKA